MEVLDGWLADGCGCFWRSSRRELELVPTDDHEQELESRNRQHNEAQSNGQSDGFHGQKSTNAPLQSSGGAVETFNDEEHISESADIVSAGSCCGSHEWIFRRWAMVLLCSGIVLAVKNNLGILVRHICRNKWCESHRCTSFLTGTCFTPFVVLRWPSLEQSARLD